MFKTLSNAFKVKDLRKKLIYTFMMLWVIRIGAFITIPGIDKAAVANTLSSAGGVMDLFDTFSGGALKNMSLFALGIVPYINASIVMSLLTIVIPKLEEMQKEGDDGRKKIAKITRYATVGFAALQAFGITVGLGRSNWFYNFTGFNIFAASLIAILALTAGTAFLMWIGERITENGVGNGISFIIFVSILSRLPDGVISLWKYVTLGKPIQVILLLIVFIAMIVLVIMLQLGERRIPVQYAKRMQGRKVYGGQTTYIPVRVNTAGVIPVIFASSLLQFPSTITSLITQTPNSTWAKVLNFVSISSLTGGILYFVLIIGFTFFYASITFNPIEVANNMKKNSGSIPGLRPGKPTSDYLINVMNRITLVGAIALGIIAIAPVIFSNVSGVSVAFGGTSLIIVVGVALDTVKQLEAQLVMRNYKGFLK